MDRPIVYPGAIPLDTDLLATNRYGVVGLGRGLQAVLGTGTLVDGLGCGPTTPASLAVAVAPGTIYSLQNVDGTAYGSLPSDTGRQIVKQGILADTATLSTPAPATAGQSVIYLIQAAYSDQDTDPVILPYYNAANPAQAYSGPNNTGVAQNTTRKGACLVSAKAGTATAGTPTAPAPDAGYVGLYTVQVSNGQASVTAPNVAVASGAPFIGEKLTQKISKATADTYYAPEHGQCRLRLNGTNLQLSPYNGNKLVVNGVMQAVPAAGVTLGTGSTAANTTYNVYAYMTAGVMTLEASATAFAVDAATGVTVKSGDATRTLVGAARTTSANLWAFSATQMLVLSWFNRGLMSVTVFFGTARSTTATTPSEIGPGARAETLYWGDEQVTVNIAGSMSNPSGCQASIQPANNGVVTGAALAATLNNTTSAFGSSQAIGFAGSAAGFMYVTAFAATSAGTVTFSADTYLNVMTQG